MFDKLTQIAESKIREAIKKGELKNLPGAGKRIKIDNMLFVPAEDRLAYTILKNAGLAPNEVALKKEMETLQNSIDECVEVSTQNSLKKKLEQTTIRYRVIMEKRSRR